MGRPNSPADCPPIDRALRNALWDHRFHSGATVNQIAFEAGVSQSVLQRFVVGQDGIRTSMTLRNATKLAQYLDLILVTKTCPTHGHTEPSSQQSHGSQTQEETADR